MIEYKPFGAEWAKAMLRHNKQELVGFLRASYVTNIKYKDALYEILEYPEERASYDIAEKALEVEP